MVHGFQQGQGRGSPGSSRSGGGGSAGSSGSSGPCRSIEAGVGVVEGWVGVWTGRAQCAAGVGSMQDLAGVRAVSQACY